VKKKVKVFFNASVIIAGLHSPKGGSGKLLNWVDQEKIKGLISEIVFYEVFKHTGKTGLNEERCRKKVLKIFDKNILSAPRKISTKFRTIVKDEGDIHLLESSKSCKIDYLVSLDKKHILSLQEKVKDFEIVSPGELILKLSS
jgi:putative PIN family toxin of toxin-antitoxin system